MKRAFDGNGLPTVNTANVGRVLGDQQTPTIEASFLRDMQQLREEVALLTTALEREKARVGILTIGKEIERLLEERDDLADEYGLPTPWLHS